MRIGADAHPEEIRLEGTKRFRRPLPMLIRVFVANAVVFVAAWAVLSFAPVSLQPAIKLDEVVILLAGLMVMLLVDLLFVRQALAPLGRLSRVMGTVDLLRPGQRAAGFERSSSEVLALAEAFNEMLERLERERRDSSARALAAQERERLWIARELHDEVGQMLSAVSLRAQLAMARAGDDRDDLAELVAIAQHSLQDVRRIMRELRPEALDELGLANALIALCGRIDEQGGLRVRRQIDGRLPMLDPDVELAIYRIAQEALTNAMRHSRASEVALSLSCADGELRLNVSDNGRGLPEPLTEGGGLTGMRERALLIGGDLEVGSSRGAGVLVALRLSVARAGGRP